MVSLLCVDEARKDLCKKMTFRGGTPFSKLSKYEKISYACAIGPRIIGSEISLIVP